MMVLLSFLLLGILIGLSRRTPRKFFNLSTKMVNVGLFGLLFFMGVRLGTYPDILKEVKTIGFTACLFAFFTLTGSVIVVWIMEKTLPQNPWKVHKK